MASPPYRLAVPRACFQHRSERGVPAIPCGRRWSKDQNDRDDIHAGCGYGRRMRSTGEDKPSPLPSPRFANIP
jgi:hypothetical protein